jgi:hypothetical protein
VSRRPAERRRAHLARRQRRELLEDARLTQVTLDVGAALDDGQYDAVAELLAPLSTKTRKRIARLAGRPLDRPEPEDPDHA